MNIRYDHHAGNYKLSIIEGKSTYGFQINKKSGIQTISQDFFQKWNSALKMLKNS